MRELASDLDRALRDRLFPALRRLEPEYLVAVDGAHARDDFGDELQAILEEIRAEHVGLSEQRAEVIAREMVARENRRHRDRFYAAIEDVVGINLAAVVDEGDLTARLKLKTRENVGLIKSIPEEYFEKVETLVYENVIQGRTSAKSLIEEIVEVGEVTDRRARFIARDQTAKLTATLNQERNQALGIKEYIWRTSRDERVRESHKEKNGKRFSWDDPPEDTGHPGQDFQCRCSAEPVIEV